jgi:2-keto-4-pentenoate hydratase
MTNALTPDRNAAIDAAAARLLDAAVRVQPCDPVRDLIGCEDVALAYAVQQRLTEHRVAAGARIVGRKIGLTSPAVQRQLGVDRPDFGVLFDDMNVSDGKAADSGRLLQPRAEAEIAFVLAQDMAEGPLGEAAARSAIAYAVAALEIVDSRVRDWDITIADTVADNASSGLFVLGSRRVRVTEFEPAEVAMALAKDGHVVSTGDGRACLGDPLTALAWLARTAREFGSPLRAGDIVLSGALGAMVDVTPGSSVVAELSVLGRVAATFAAQESR